MSARLESWAGRLLSLGTGPVIAITAIFVIAIGSCIRQILQLARHEDIPWGLSYMRYLPRWISGMIHSRHARTILHEAYKRHPGRPFRLARHDTDIIVLPESIFDELAALPDNIATHILALQYDLVGGWCGLGTLKATDIHQRVVQRRITPNLLHLTTELEDEVHECFSAYLPQPDAGWVEFEPYPIFDRIAARVFSRIVVGQENCQSEQWLDFAMNFTDNVFHSIVFLRKFPPWTYPILGRLLPSVRACTRNIREAENLLGPIFQQLLEEQDAAGGEKKAPLTSAPNTCLSWLLELAAENERDPQILVHSQILLSLGAIHTSLFAQLNFLFDLTAHPDDIEPIRSEVTAEAEKGWTHTSYAALHKLDSTLRESQRLSPTFMVTLRRVMKQQHTFSNGITVHPGAYVCVYTPAVQNSRLQEEDGDPDDFRGLRSYEKKAREKTLNSNSAKHQFSTTDGSVLGFGYGRTACPGRFTASLALKMIFAKLVTEYEFQFLDGATTKPAHLTAHEINWPDPSVKMRIRHRNEAVLPY